MQRKIEYLLTPSQAKNLIVKLYKKAYEEGTLPLDSFILIGAPGIGKSETVKRIGEEIAEFLHREFIEFDLTIADKIYANPDKYFVYVDTRIYEHEPSDFSGIPRLVEVNAKSSRDYVTRFVPVDMAKVLAYCPGILALEDITNTERRDLRSVLFKVLLNYMMGYQKLNKLSLIIGTGNAPEHSALAHEFEAPINTRVIYLYVKPPTVEEWIAYMDKVYPNANKRVLAYVLLNKEEFMVPQKEAYSLEPYPCPRSWTKLAVRLGEDPKSYLTDLEIKALCIGAVGVNVGVKVADFVLLNVPTIDEVAQNPSKLRHLREDVLYAFTVMFAQNVKKNKEMLIKREKGKLVLNEKYARILDTILDISHELAIVFCYALGQKRFEIAMELYRLDPRFKKFIDLINELKTKYAYV